MEKDVWGKSFERESKGNIRRFTSVVGFMPFSLEGFNITTKWIEEKDKKILEAGCGTGRFCIELARRFPDSDIIGVDISDKALKMAKEGYRLRRLKNISFRKGDIFKLPFKDNFFDVVFNKGVIEHFNNYDDIIREMVRVTKKGGKVIIAVPNKYNIIHPLTYYVHKNITHTYAYGMEIMFTPKELMKSFKEAGLKDLKQDGFNIFYRLSKMTRSENIILKSLQFILRIISIILHYLVNKPLDFISGNLFSKIFGWEIVVTGRK